MGKEEDRQQLAIVVQAISRVPVEIRQSIYQLSQTKDENALIQSFNQHSRDMFTLLERIAKSCGRLQATQLVSHRSLFDAAIAIQKRIAIDKFTLLVLEFAPEIYSKDEEAFLQMTIPETDVKTSAGFGVIRSNEFRDMWVKDMTPEMKSDVTTLITRMVMTAHAFFYKTVAAS